MDEAVVPTHLGLILDGNRRWARERGLPTLEGHSRGYDNLKDIAKAAFDRGVKYVSAYIFSTENWDRTKKEVGYLMNLALRMLTRDVAELNNENIKLIWLGRPNNLSKKLLKAIKDAEELTQNNTRGTLCLCFNYGGKLELADAFKSIAEKGINPDEITTDLINEHLYCDNVPAVDLVIRTSGEKRISGFMLWRVAYSELEFLDKYWPDFNNEDLDAALISYAKRHRRFGK